MPPNWFEKWIRVHGTDLKGNAIIPSDVTAYTAAVFDHPAEWESDTFLDADDTTRIVIPRGLAGRYFLRATVCWEKGDNQNFIIPDRDNSCFLGYFTKNGDTLAHHLEDTHMSAAPVVKAMKTVMHMPWEGTLRRGDVIKLYLCHDGTINDTTGIPISVTAKVWLVLRRLGPPV